MDLGGTWRAREADDAGRRSFPDPDRPEDDWEPLEVPGHWRSTPAFASSDGPLWYRRRFERREPEPDGKRRWLDFAGIFYQADVWLDGSYLGDTEGYFAPHSFEVTAPLAARRDHLLAIEVACAPETDPKAKHNLTGAFQGWGGIDQAWNPGGIWAPVAVTTTGAVRIRSWSVSCRDASTERATLAFEAVLDAGEAGAVTLDTVVRGPLGGDEVVAASSSDQALAAGANTVRWRLRVDRPRLWWPRGLGEQALHTVELTVTAAGRRSDQRTVRTGLRQVRMRDFSLSVNGERLFAKGANLGPTRRALGEASAADLGGDVQAAVDANLNLVRIHAHVTRDEVYDAADRAGLLVWQDLPLQGAYQGVRRAAVHQARAAVEVLGHHPSVVIWCGHNEPGRNLGVLPTWSRTRLDTSVRRALEKADGSRPVVAHSGVPPHPTGGTDSHDYLGWYQGDVRDLPGRLARFPVLARWVGEFGAQAVPEAAGFMHPPSWPDLDWEGLASAHGLEKAVFDERVPPADYPNLPSWRRATQRYQADIIRFHVETLRRLKYRPTGGFCQFLLADAQPAVSFSILDHKRRAKAGYDALRAACAAVVVVADRPAASYRPGEWVRLDVHVVSDLREPLTAARVEASVRWPGGRRHWGFDGDVAADSCARVGRLALALPRDAAAGDIDIELTLTRPGVAAVTNAYRSRVEDAPG